jgi:tetratricopeptide (TPR) repeat protein
MNDQNAIAGRWPVSDFEFRASDFPTQRWLRISGFEFRIFSFAMVLGFLHPNRRAGREKRTDKPRKRWYERTSVTLCVAAGLVVVALGFVHIIIGVTSPYELPFDIVRKDSFGYRETLVDARKIQALPYPAARREHPRGLRALQKGGYLPAGRDFETAMMAGQRESIQRWQAQFEESLGRPATRWQDRLRGEGQIGELDPEDARACNQRGFRLARNGEYAGALAEFGRAIRKDPTSADALYNRALVHIALGNFGPAASDFGAVVAIRPDFVEGHLRRGRLLAAMNEHDQAIAAFTRAIEIDAQCAEAFFQRSLAYYSKGMCDQAWDDVHKVQALGRPVPAGFLRALRGESRTGKLEISSSPSR